VAQKPSATRNPCTAAVRPVPTSVVKVTSRKRSRSTSALAADKGMNGRTLPQAPWGETSR